MAKRAKKSRFKKLSGFISKSLSLRQFKSLLGGAVRDAMGEAAESPMRRPSLTKREKALRDDFRARGGASGMPGAPKPYSSLTQNLGKQILSLGGNNLPPAIRAAAIDAVNGGGSWKNERELQDALRGATGIQKSGASWLNRKVSAVRSTFRGAANAAVMYDVASRGGIQGGMAQSELLQMAGDKVEDLTHNKFVQKVSVGVAKYLGRSPLEAMSFLRAIGRGVRLGGAIGAVAQLGVGVAEEYFSNQKRASAARIRQFDDAQRMGIDVGMSRSIRTGTVVSSETGITGWLKTAVGYTGGIEEERAGRLNEKFKIINDARKVAGKLGVDVSGMLQARAQKLGIGVDDLTPEEVNETLQPVLAKAARKKVSGDAVERELEARGTYGNAEKKISDQLGYTAYLPVMQPVLWAARLLDLNTAVNLTPDKLKAESDKIIDEMAQKHLTAMQEENEKAAAVQRRAKRDQARVTQMQIRDYRMNEQSYGRRKQVAWAD